MEGHVDPAVGLVTAYLEQCGYFVLTQLPLPEPVGDGYRDVTIRFRRVISMTPLTFCSLSIQRSRPLRKAWTL
jgi:hypothetical protein